MNEKTENTVYWQHSRIRVRIGSQQNTHISQECCHHTIDYILCGWFIFRVLTIYIYADNDDEIQITHDTTDDDITRRAGLNVCDQLFWICGSPPQCRNTKHNRIWGKQSRKTQYRWDLLHKYYCVRLCYRGVVLKEIRETKWNMVPPPLHIAWHAFYASFVDAVLNFR